MGDNYNSSGELPIEKKLFYYLSTLNLFPTFSVLLEPSADCPRELILC